MGKRQKIWSDTKRYVGTGTEVLRKNSLSHSRIDAAKHSSNGLLAGLHDHTQKERTDETVAVAHHSDDCGADQINPSRLVILRTLFKNVKLRVKRQGFKILFEMSRVHEKGQVHQNPASADSDKSVGQSLISRFFL